MRERTTEKLKNNVQQKNVGKQAAIESSESLN